MIKRFALILIANCWVFCSKAQQFQPLPPGFGYDVIQMDADTSNNLLYACGAFRYLADSTPANSIAVWNGTNWDPSLSAGITGPLSSVLFFNNNIYTAGYVSYNINGNQYSGVGVWDGTSRSIIPISSGQLDYPYRLYEHQNNLFVWGLFNSIGGVLCDNIARYDGSWHGYPSLNLYPNLYTIYDAVVFQNELYISGLLPLQNGDFSIAKFNGTNWIQVGNWPVASGIQGVYCFHEWNNNLYIGGYFDTNGGFAGNGIVRWDGSNFYPLSSGLSGNVEDIIDFNNELYACGSMNVAGNPAISFIAKWDGVQWQSVGTFDHASTCFEKMNGKLYIGGVFQTVNGDTMNCITMYDPTVGITENDKKYTALKTYPNPFSKEITVTTTGGHVEYVNITNQFGQTVFKKKLDEVNGLENNFFDLCLERLPKGVYNLQVGSKTKTESCKIVKE